MTSKAAYLARERAKATKEKPEVKGGKLERMLKYLIEDSDISKSVQAPFKAWGSTMDDVYAGRQIPDDVLAERMFDVAGAVSLGSIGAPKPRGALTIGASKKPKAKRLTELPSLRDMSPEDAVKIAKREPHLIKSGDHAEGMYIGGPRDVKSRKDLLRMRRKFDATAERDPRGADWYDRTRNAITEVTGGDKRQADWMAAQHGQMSAGVDPYSELGFAIKDNNGHLMGMPVKAARPAQLKASTRAIEEMDPRRHQLGKKTGQYADKINPNLSKRTAVGTNDFRHARNFGYTDPQGNPVTNAHGEGQHTFMDYETALAVGRANKNKLGGRSDWDGEKLQAAPWVVQKGDDIHGRRPNLSREQAFLEANKTIADSYPQFEAYATHEQVPGRFTGHLPGAVKSSSVDRTDFSMDPRSSWDMAPGGRDGIYAGLEIEGTGVAGRVRPSREMQGMFTPEGGETEFNPGRVARPLVGFEAGDVKGIDAASREMLMGGEMTRAFTDVQAGGAAHKTYYGGKRGMSNSLGAIAKGQRTPEQMRRMAEAGKKYGLPDVSDTGEGFTVTRFYPEPDKISNKQFKALDAELKQINPDMEDARPARVDGVYADMAPDFLRSRYALGEGFAARNGAATDKLITQLTQNPTMQKTFDNNPYPAQKALANLLRDPEYIKTMGYTREDIQNVRRIMAGNGDPRGWLTRLIDARKRGVIAPGLAGALLSGAAMEEGLGDE
jgi:hypothetical protein